MVIGLAAIVVASTLAAQEVAPAPAAPTASDRLRAATSVLNDLPGLTLTGYEVSGRSPNAVRRAMNSARPPAGTDRERHDALTSWRYSTRWRNGSDGQCSPATAEVAVTITVVLPDLTTREQLSSRERADWDRYFTALVGHEHNHGRIAIAGRDQMQAAMRVSASCEAMQAVVRQTSNEVSAASREYDRLTEHGKLEGAVYPSETR